MKKHIIFQGGDKSQCKGTSNMELQEHDKELKKIIIPKGNKT